MNIIVQWIIVGVILCGAAAYLLRIFVFRREGTAADPGCGSCASCPAAEKMAARIAALGDEPVKE